MRSIWTGTLSLEAIDAPVALYKARESHDLSFRQIAPNGGRVSQVRVDSDANPVEWADIRKGYELEDGTYVIVEDEDFDALMPEASKTITINEFVPSIDPIYYENTYIMGISKKAEKEDKKRTLDRYSLMCAVIGDRIAVGTFVYRQRQHVVAIRHKDGVLYLSTLYYADEVREAPAMPQGTVSDMALKAATALAEVMTSEFDMSKYHDDYTERLQQMIHVKAAGGTYAAPVEAAAVAADTEDQMIAELKAATERLSAVKTGIPAGEAVTA